MTRNRVARQNHKSRVSVICATHNGSKHILASIKALASQSEPTFESIFVDDGSDDETPDILSANRLPNSIIFRNHQNHGVVHARNRAIELSSSKYLAINDQDDMSLPSRLSSQANLLDRNQDVSCVFARYRTVDFNGIPISAQTSSAIGYSGELARAGLIFKNFITHSTIMFRREAIADQAYVFEYPLCEDYSLLMRLAGWKKGLLFMPQTLVLYREHSDNLSKSKRELINRLSIRIKREALAMLDLNPSDNEMMIHERFSSEPFVAEPSILPSCREWLNLLASKNRQRNHISPCAFESVLANEWLELCHRFHFCGLETWREYNRGRWTLPLSSYPSLLSLWLKTRKRKLI